MAQDAKEIKNFNMRLDKELWMFLKAEAAATECSMTDIISDCVKKLKRKKQNKLTQSDAHV